MVVVAPGLLSSIESARVLYRIHHSIAEGQSDQGSGVNLPDTEQRYDVKTTAKGSAERLEYHRVSTGAAASATMLGPDSLSTTERRTSSPSVTRSM